MSFLSGLGAGVAGVVGSRITGEWQNEQQEKMAKQQYLYQKDLQNESYRLGNMYWNAQFDKQNEYNLPSNQVNRLLAAGINPFVDGSTASPISSNADSSSVAGGAPSVPLPSAASYPSVAGSVAQLVSAVKESESIPYVQDQLKAEIKRLLASARSDDAKATLDEITGRIQREFGRENADKALKLLTKKISEVQSIIDKNDSESLLNWKRGLVADAEQTLTANKVNEFRTYVDKLYQVYDSQISANKASANQSNTQAAVNREITTEKQLENGLNAALFDGKIDQFEIQINKLKSEAEITESQVEVARAAAAVAQYEKDNAAMLFWRDFILETLGKSVDIATAVRSWKNISSYSSLSESKKREVDLQVQKFDREILEKKAGKKVERTRRTSQGNIKETYYQNK